MAVCGWMAYDYDVESPPTVLGLPDWIFWGVFVPWIAAGAFTIWYALYFIVDDDEEFAREKLTETSAEQGGRHE